MADRIIVSTEEMQQAISSYEAARETMQSAFQNLANARNALDQCWDGPAKQRYVNRWTEIYNNLTKSDQAIEKALNGLKNTVNISENAETDVTGRANKLEHGSTPPNIF